MSRYVWLPETQADNDAMPGGTRAVQEPTTK